VPGAGGGSGWAAICQSFASAEQQLSWTNEKMAV
jgi:hypothetical protein